MGQGPEPHKEEVELVIYLFIVMITDNEDGAGALVIKAEETKQQISRLNNEVWKVWHYFT